MEGFRFMTTLSKALEVVQSLHQDASLLKLLTILEEQPKAQRGIFLATIGMYQSQFEFTNEDLDSLYRILGPLAIESLPFAEATFDRHIEKLSFETIGTQLKHSLFFNFRAELSRNVLYSLVEQPHFPKELYPSQVEALIPGNYDHLNIVSQVAFKAILSSMYRQQSERSPSQGYSLAMKLKHVFGILKQSFNPFLFLIDFTESEISFLRRLAKCFFAGAIRNNDLKDFLGVWGDGGLLFFSCMICSGTLEKETNRDFWLEYYTWLDLIDKEKKYNQIRVNRAIKSFWDSEGISYCSSQSGTNQYVQTFLMHSIVSNRPLSKKLAVKFLVRIIKGSGVVYHDDEDQQEILQLQLKEYSQPITEENDPDNQSNPYLQLPRETALAFCCSAGQVVEFLLPIYDYLERHLIDKANNDTTSFSSQPPVIPEFILPSVEDAIASTSIEEIKGMRSVLSVFKKGKATILLDTENWKLDFIIPQYVFSDLDTNVAIDFTLSSKDMHIYHDESIQYDTVKTTIITRELIIPCQLCDSEYTYQFACNNRVLAKGVIPGGYLFDLQGDPLEFPCKVAQYAYCLAAPDTVLADELVELRPNFIQGFSLWETYLSEQTPLILNNRLYGIDSETSLAFSRKVGYTIGHNAYHHVKFLSNQCEYQVIGEYPTFFMRYSSSFPLEEDIMISVDGMDEPYSVITRSMLLDGSGEAFFRIKLSSATPLTNANITCIRIFSALAKKELLAVSFFVLKDLTYGFSEELYTRAEDVTLEYLDFEDKKQLFYEHYYRFPNPLSKYKLSMENDQDCRLVFLPPLISVHVQGKNLLDQDCWYAELSEGEDITVTVPQDITSVKLFTLDSTGNVKHELKKRGESYKVQYLRQEPETSEPFVTLTLSAFGKNKQRFNQAICKIYYKVYAKPQTREPVLYIPSSDQIRISNIKVGLDIKQEFFCNKSSEYVVKLLNAKNTVIASWSMVGSTSKYYQEKELVAGEYSLSVFENTKNLFTKRESEKLVYSQVILYKTNAKKHTITPCSNDVEPDCPQTKPWHEIQLLYSIKRVWGRDGATYERVKRLASFHMKTQGTLAPKEICRAVGYFLDMKGNRYEMSASNPLQVTVLEKCKADRIIFSVCDRDEKPLKVGDRSGYINPLKPKVGERLCECKLFEGLVIR